MAKELSDLNRAYLDAIEKAWGRERRYAVERSMLGLDPAPPPARQGGGLFGALGSLRGAGQKAPKEFESLVDRNAEQPGVVGELQDRGDVVTEGRTTGLPGAGGQLPDTGSDPEFRFSSFSNKRDVAFTTGAVPTKAQITRYIRQAAKARGIDPNIAVRVAKSEGLNANPDDGWQSDYVKNGVREPSFGPYQLYMGGGLGNEFQELTGYHPSDPASVFMQVDFALDKAAQDGWGAWYGAGRVGISKWQGLKDAQPAGITATYGGPVPSEDIPNTSFVDTYGTLRQKKSPKVDERVRFLQKTLNSQFGFDLTEDGRFGPATDAAVRAMQKTMGLNADGVVGKNTWSGIERVVRPAPTYRGAQEAGLPAPSFRSAQEAGMAPSPRSPGPDLAARTRLPAQAQLSIMESEAARAAKRPSPLDALSDVSTRPSARPAARPGPYAPGGDAPAVAMAAGLSSPVVDRIMRGSNVTRPGPFAPGGDAPGVAMAADLPGPVVDRIMRGSNVTRPGPFAPGGDAPAVAMAAELPKATVDRIMGTRPSPTNFAPSLDQRLQDAKQKVAALTAPQASRPKPSSISDLVRGSTTTPPKRPSPFDALSGVSTRPPQRTAAITAPLPRPRPTVAARPPAPPEERPSPTGFLGTGAPSFRSAQEVGLRPATVAAPLPRPSPVPPGQVAASSARRVVTAPRPRPSLSRGTPARSAAPSRPASRVSANTQSKRKSSLSRAGSD